MSRSSTNFFRHGELPMVLLAMLAEQPRHAYQLLARLERLFGPDYEPSTGSVYPALIALGESNFVTAAKDGRRRVYSLTPTGRRALARNGETLAEIEARTGVRLTASDVDGVLARFATRVKAASGIDGDSLEAALDRVLRTLVDQ